MGNDKTELQETGNRWGQFQKRTSITPTLVIGCGGTGVDVARELRRRVRSHLSVNPSAPPEEWRAPGVIRFLGLDTMPWENPPNAERLRRSEYVVRSWRLGWVRGMGL